MLQGPRKRPTFRARVRRANQIASKLLSGHIRRNLYDPEGPTYQITTDRNAPVQPRLVIVKSYGDVLRDYRLHPEHKFNAPDGGPCRRGTRGQLSRRTVRSNGLLHLIGKEANHLDEVQAGIVGSIDEVLTDYTPPSDAWFRDHVLRVLARTAADKSPR